MGYEQLEADLGDLSADTLWLREYATDRPLIEFFTRRGYSLRPSSVFKTVTLSP